MKNLENGKENTYDKLLNILYSSIAGIAVGIVFSLIFFSFDVISIIEGMVMGFLVFTIISTFENYIFRPRYRKLRFATILVFRMVFYLIVVSFSVLLVWVLNEARLENTGFFEVIRDGRVKDFILRTEFIRILIFTSVVSILIIYISQMSYLLGQNVLLRYLSGKYYEPVVEERFFMFLDLTSSTTLAERSRPIEYHTFLNNYFYDVDGPILKSKGEVFQYAGDQVVITWTEKNGRRKANCIKCFFRIKNKIESLESIYKDKFGMVPKIKAGMHFGKVVVGEIGDSKKEIVYHGDVINTASRIQEECNVLNKNFLVSAEVLDFIDLPEKYESKLLGEFFLKGKEQAVELYSIEEVNLNQSGEQ